MYRCAYEAHFSSFFAALCIVRTHVHSDLLSASPLLFALASIRVLSFLYRTGNRACPDGPWGGDRLSPFREDGGRYG
jgi:hypothetical protein